MGIREIWMRACHGTAKHIRVPRECAGQNKLLDACAVSGAFACLQVARLPKMQETQLGASIDWTIVALDVRSCDRSRIWMSAAAGSGSRLGTCVWSSVLKSGFLEDYRLAGLGSPWLPRSSSTSEACATSVAHASATCKHARLARARSASCSVVSSQHAPRHAGWSWPVRHHRWRCGSVGLLQGSPLALSLSLYTNSTLHRAFTAGCGRKALQQIVCFHPCASMFVSCNAPRSSQQISHDMWTRPCP